jgi:hypothetical protein
MASTLTCFKHPFLAMFLSEKPPVTLKITDIIKKLESEGWVLVMQKGSHNNIKI